MGSERVKTILTPSYALRYGEALNVARMKLLTALQKEQLPFLGTLACALFFLHVVSCRADTLQIDSCKKVKEITPQVEALRALRAKRSITCIELESEKYDQAALRASQKENTLSKIRNEEILFKALGIIPVQYPYTQCMYFESGDLSDARYDSYTHQLILRRNTSIPGYILAHEITHALQDQHFNLSKIFQAIKSTKDQLASNALVEGDAMRIEELFKNQNSLESKHDAGAQAMHTACELPPILADLIYFPYEWGARFASTITTNGDSKLNEYFSKQPPTLHEVLYNVLDNRSERLRDIYSEKICSENPKGSQLLFTDSLGEFVLRKLLIPSIGMSEGIQSAKGLKNDSIRLYRLAHRNERYAITWDLTFETTERAHTGLQGLVHFLEKQFQISLSAAPHIQAQLPDGTVLTVDALQATIKLSIQ